MKNPDISRTRLRVWDLPTRLFHWLMVACLLGLFGSAYWPGGALAWHARLGHAVLALLLFRLAWGVVGGHWSRWVRMVPSPRRAWRYLRGQGTPADRLGHNPLASLAVLALVVILGAQVATGLVSDDEIAFTGPLNRFVSIAAGLAATHWHKNVGQWLVLAWAALHLIAIGWHQFRLRDALVGGMVHGDREVPGDVAASQPASRDDGVTRAAALVLLALCIGIAVAVERLGA